MKTCGCVCVQVSSKKQVTEQMDRYKELLKKVLDGQSAMDQQTKTRMLNNMLEVSLFRCIDTLIPHFIETD